MIFNAVENNRSLTLIPIITRLFFPGTLEFTDSAKVYNILTSLKHYLLKFNHKLREFTNRNTRSTKKMLNICCEIYCEAIEDLVHMNLS